MEISRTEWITLKGANGDGERQQNEEKIGATIRGLVLSKFLYGKDAVKATSKPIQQLSMAQGSYLH